MFSRWKKSKTEAALSRSTQVAEVPDPEPDAPAYEIVASVLTDVGCHRTVNEDHARFVRPFDPKRLAGRGALIVVADGMGGHAAGEIASRTAVDVILKTYYERTGAVQEALEAAFHEANRAIYAEAGRNTRRKGMGTTATALVLRGGQAFLAHVGDSRLYLVRGGELYLLSEDHSLVREMVREGLISSDEARHHEDKNVLVRALGTKLEVEVAAWPEPLHARPGDQFLLCSDGLYDLVEDDEIRGVVTTKPPHEAGEQLIALAKERGGYDNITVGIVRLVPPGEQAPNGKARDTRATPIPGDAV